MVEFGPDTYYGRTTSWYQRPRALLRRSIFKWRVCVPSTTYHMRSVLQCEGDTLMSDDHTFTTGALPAITFPTVHVSRPNPTAEHGKSWD